MRTPTAVIASQNTGPMVTLVSTIARSPVITNQAPECGRAPRYRAAGMPTSAFALNASATTVGSRPTRSAPMAAPNTKDSGAAERVKPRLAKITSVAGSGLERLAYAGLRGAEISFVGP